MTEALVIENRQTVPTNFLLKIVAFIMQICFKHKLFKVVLPFFYLFFSSSNDRFGVNLHKPIDFHQQLQYLYLSQVLTKNK